MEHLHLPLKTTIPNARAAIDERHDIGLVDATGVIIGELWLECPNLYISKKTISDASKNAEYVIRAANAFNELLAACQYVADLTGCALDADQANTLRKRCLAAIALANGQ